MPVSPIVAARTPQIDKNKLRQDWNTYVDWLESKGLKGSTKLDVGDTPETNEGMKKVKEYAKLFPNSLVKPENVKIIQQEFIDLRGRMNKDVSEGRASMETKQDIFPGLSTADEKPGSKTTSFKFPTGEFKLPSGEVKKTGFVTVEENFQNLDPSLKQEIKNAQIAASDQAITTQKNKAKLSVKNPKVTTQTQPTPPIPPTAAIRQPIVQKAIQDLGLEIYGPSGSLIGFLKEGQFSEASGDYIKGINKGDLELLQGDTNKLNDYLKQATQGVAKPYVRPMPK
jgi:hypothetical protein